jgi:hypothetical protein
MDGYDKSYLDKYTKMATFKRPEIRKWKSGSFILPPPGRVYGNGRLVSIINSIRDPPAAKEWRPKFVPIADIDGYINALKNAGTSEEELEMIREKHERHISPPPAKYVYKPATTPQMPVKTKLKVKGEKVKLSLCVPYDHVLDYTYKAKKVPFDVMIRCMKMNGASDEFLLKQIQKHDAAKKSRKKDDEKFDAIFDKYNKTKTKPVVFKPVKKMDPIF